MSAFLSRKLLVPGLLALCLAGCGSKGAVSLSARLDNPTLTFKSSALVTALQGGFDLVLELGQHASEPTSVSLGTFTLRDQSRVLVDSLSLTPSETFPVDVAVGATNTVRLTLDNSNSVDASDAALASELSRVCAGTNVWFEGSVSDTLSGGKPSPASSALFAASCE